MKEVNYSLNPYTQLVTGDNLYILLDNVIELHNQYFDVFKSKNKGKTYKVHWNGAIRLRLNDIMALTNWKRDKARKTLNDLVTGITYQGKTFKPLRGNGTPKYDKQGRNIPSGYYILDVDELERLDKFCSTIKVNWVRDSGAKQLRPTDIIKTIAEENYKILENRH